MSPSRTSRSQMQKKPSVSTKARSSTAGTAKKSSTKSSKSSTKTNHILTPEQIKEVAKGMIQNRYLFSTQIPKGQESLFPIIFMPLAFASKKILKEMKDKRVSVLYEEISKAVPNRSINGFPFFPSMRTMTLEDYNEAVEMYERMKSAMDAAV